LAIERFQFESLPVIDGCVGPVRGPRAREMVLARFERISTSAASDVFVVRDVTLPPRPAAGGGRLDPRAVDCIGRLRGRQIVLPAKVAPDDRSVLIQPLMLLLPMQGGAGPPR